VLTACTAVLHTKRILRSFHRVFPFCIVPEQRFIISLYRIALFGLRTDTECVYCVVQTVSLNILRLITVEARVRSKLGQFEICGGRNGSGACFSPSTLFSSVSVIPPVLQSHLHLHAALTGRTIGVVPKS
jgi:hypothetical protein